MSYEFNREFTRMVIDCAAAGERLSREHTKRGDHRPLLLWYQPGTPERPGAILLAYDKPVWTPAEGWSDGWKLAPQQGKGITADVPWARYERWVRERAESLPILKGNT